MWITSQEKIKKDGGFSARTQRQGKGKRQLYLGEMQAQEQAGKLSNANGYVLLKYYIK